MRERLRRVVPYLGYVAFYIFVFAWACYVSFPYERLRDRLVAELSNQQHRVPSAAPPPRVEIDDLSPYWLTGVRATGVRVVMAPKPAMGGDAEKPPTVIELEEVHVRLGVLAKIFGATNVTFWARALGGEAEGRYVDGSTDRSLDLELRELLVGRIEPLTSLLNAPLGGTANGKLVLEMPEKRPSKANGTIALTLADFTLGDGKAKLLDAVTLPKINVGELVIEGEAKDGVLRITKLASAGGDLELAGEGKITLRDTAQDSLADLYVRFKFNDAYRAKNDMTKSLLGEPGSSIPPALELTPKVKQSKRPDGFYGWHMMGTLQNPRFDPYSSTPPTTASQGSPVGTAVLDKVRNLPSLRNTVSPVPNGPVPGGPVPLGERTRAGAIQAGALE